MSMSSDNEDYPDKFKKRRGKDPFFGEIDDVFREMEKMMDEELKNFTEKVPKEYIKERKLPDGSTVKELGPFVYGHSMKIGPDGKPEIQEFGNIKKGLKGTPQVKEEREPLVDTVETEKDVHVVVELPGRSDRWTNASCRQSCRCRRASYRLRLGSAKRGRALLCCHPEAERTGWDLPRAAGALEYGREAAASSRSQFKCIMVVA